MRNSPATIPYKLLRQFVAIDPKVINGNPLIAARHNGCNSKGKPIGSTKGNGYRRITIGGQKLRASRVVWALVHGDWPPAHLQIDHIDRNRVNDCPSNLRLCTASQNSANKGLRKDNVTGCTGVSVTRNGTFKAKIAKDGEVKLLGTFRCFEAAKAERCKAERHLFGAFARSAQEVQAGV